MESRENFVIGITGSVGSGCTEISEILEKESFQRLSLSDLIKKKFKEIHRKEPTFEDFGEDWRLELQNIGNYGREGKYSPNNNGDNKGYWVELALKTVEDNHNGDLVIDGIRNRGEIEFLRNTFPQTQFWLIAVYADYETRYQRVKDKYPDERIFRRDDNRDSNEEDEPFGQNVELCVREADYVFNNNKAFTPENYRHKTISKKILEDIDT
ncbi:MAG: AAA family ATPase [Sedimentisphaerales bacterium]|nr:AAA family ATPase [Sedimentisphaerales bacterium]